MSLLWSALVVIVGLVSFLGLSGMKAPASRKAQQAKAMKEAYKSMESRPSSPRKVSNKASTEKLKISQLWIYPIKSLRGCQVPSAAMTRQGFYLDRRFMLLAEDEKAPSKLKNMHIAHYASMCLFQPTVNGNTLRISYRNPQKDNFCADHLDIPLEPENFQNLAPVPVVMHSSATIGYNMGEKYNDWFSQKFGFKVVLAYSGGNTRPVLGNLPGKPANHSPPPKSAIMTAISFIPMLGPLFEGDNERIAFNDCAPYLVISDTSVDDVTSRLPSDVEMDLTKFRGNVVLSGAPTAYSEDFWGELTFGDNGPRIVLTGNCGRCNSLNVDHHTGKSGTGKDGQVLKLLAKDRRVDPGMKYSPIFGRYGFVGKGDEGSVLRVGDEVVVSQKNEERTRFYWPKLST